MTNYSTILQLKIAATLFAYDCSWGWAQLGGSSGPASGNSCGYVQLAGQLGRVGIWEHLPPVSLGAAPFPCSLCIWCLHQSCYTFYIAAQDSQRSKSSNFLSFRSRTGTMSFFHYTLLERKSQTQPRLEAGGGGDIKTVWIPGDMVHCGYQCHRPAHHTSGLYDSVSVPLP